MATNEIRLFEGNKIRSRRCELVTRGHTENYKLRYEPICSTAKTSSRGRTKNILI